MSIVPARALFESRTRASTTPLERFLLFLVAAAIPLEDELAEVTRFPALFVAFGAIGSYALLIRTRAISEVARSPVFMAGLAFIGLAVAIEGLHSDSSFRDHLRFAFALAGGLAIAGLARDAPAQRAAFLGIVIGGASLSLWFLLNAAVFLLGLAGSTAIEIAQQRGAIGDAAGLDSNLNSIAFSAAQSAAVAAALLTGKVSRSTRVGLLAAIVASFVAGALTLSRGGFATSVVSIGAVVLVARESRRSRWIALGVLALAFALVTPRLFAGRNPFDDDRRPDGREQVYRAFTDNFEAFAALGVGSGNYHGAWGERSDFWSDEGHVLMAHNAFFQVVANWGLSALAAFLALLATALRALPRPFRQGPLSLAIGACALTLMLHFVQNHAYYAKEFSLFLGLVVGGSTFAWRRAAPIPATTSSQGVTRGLAA